MKYIVGAIPFISTNLHGCHANPNGASTSGVKKRRKTKGYQHERSRRITNPTRFLATRKRNPNGEMLALAHACLDELISGILAMELVCCSDHIAAFFVRSKKGGSVYQRSRRTETTADSKALISWQRILR